MESVGKLATKRTIIPLGRGCPVCARSWSPQGFPALVVAVAATVMFASAAAAFTLPEDFGTPDFSRGPDEVLTAPRPGEPLVWLGLVERFRYRLDGEAVVLVWTCRWLPFARPGPRVLDSRPIAALAPEPALFRFEVRTRMISAEQAADMAAEIGAEPHYALLAGRFREVLLEPGEQILLLDTRKFEVHERLVRLLPEA